MVLLAASLVLAGLPPQKTIDLFNGKDLAGWEGNSAVWSVKEGAITGRSEGNLRHNTFLVWKGGELKDFELTLRYRIVGGNSGIQYRSKVVEQGPDGHIVQGYQADIDSGTTYSGILYEERGRGTLANRGQRATLRPTGNETGSPLGDPAELQKTIRNEDWNDYRIVATGNRLQHFINGRPMAEAIDEDPSKAAASGILALQLHAGPAMTVQFKAIRLKRLAP